MRLLLLLLLLLLLVAPAPATAQATLPTGFVEDVLISGFDHPLSMAFLPDRRLLVTERVSGKVRVVVNGHIAALDPALTVPEVNSDDLERGLQGIAVDPRWPQSPYIYLGYTRQGDRMALVRYTGIGAIDDPAGESLSFTSPLVLIDDFQDNSSVHNGLGLRFGVDGHLLMSTGDDSDPCSAQNPGSLRGALLRLDVSRLPAVGTGPVPRALLIPPGNPLSGPDSNARLVLAFGLRNPWRFHIDSGTGAILLADVGDGAYEELDEIQAGGNYGWPYREGLVVRERPECAPDTGSYLAPIHALTHPEFVTITTAGVYRPVPGGNANWPSEYWGNLFYGDVFNTQLRRRVRSGSAWIAPAPVPGQPNADDWATGVHLPGDFAIGPDGSLYWLKMWEGDLTPNSGSLRRIRYPGGIVIPVTDPPSAAEDRAAPNPFREHVELRWESASQPPAVEILDVTGRLVCRIESHVSGGVARAEWSGRDDDGNQVAAGLYWARPIGEPAVRPLRLLRLR